MEHWPNYLLLAVVFMSTGVGLAKAGEPRDENGNYDFSWFCYQAFSLWLFYKCGAFTAIGWAP